MSGKDLCQETGNRRIALNLYFFILLIYNFQTLLFLSPLITWDKRDKHTPAPQHIQWARRKIPLKEQKIKGGKKSAWVSHNSRLQVADSEFHQENWLILWDPNSLIFKNVSLDSSLCLLLTSFWVLCFPTPQNPLIFLSFLALSGRSVPLSMLRTVIKSH